ncbi:Lacal_2735 family protein [bacterium]|nr:Lacal_2735 family protein [bacterium]
MFNLFKKKTKLEKLDDQYKRLLERSFEMSKVNRAESDRLQAEAAEILNQIEELKS